MLHSSIRKRENPIKTMLDFKDMAIFTLLLSCKINLALIQCWARGIRFCNDLFPQVFCSAALKYWKTVNKFAEPRGIFIKRHINKGNPTIRQIIFLCMYFKNETRSAWTAATAPQWVFTYFTRQLKICIEYLGIIAPWPSLQQPQGFASWLKKNFTQLCHEI